MERKWKKPGDVLCFVPYLYCIGCCGKKRVCTMVVDRAGKVSC